ncbi:MAG: RdgB/HAM1 family non-canonical purine NTP pyrophosphatase [Methanoregulaceae archaeon]|nr:RdgB/HAM1 family non-canonical purine NTP pyrophosphatase [Methanoregulaceae archaeon]
MKIVVVTSNPHKAAEIADFFGDLVEITHLTMEIPEYRHHDVGEIAYRKAEYAFHTLACPLMVDDTAFSIEALNGFPGPYAAYALSTIGNEGILKLLEGTVNRHAYFETAIAFASDGGIRVFLGRVDGVIVSPRGTAGFGYDPIFEVEGRTLAELDRAAKNRISHRARALSRLKAWILSEEGAVHDKTVKRNDDV